MEFEYTVTRSGPNRIVTEQHRVYWTTGEERNDTIAINGTPVIPAKSQLLRRSTWPYDPGQFTVSSDVYDATPAGIAVVAGHRTFAFTLARLGQADFVLKSLYVDTKRYLPVRETFAVAGTDCEGSGSIEFADDNGYWLPSFVAVSCSPIGETAAPAALYKESIRFTSYQFPAAIPSDVFGPLSTGTPPGSGSLSP